MDTVSLCLVPVERNFDHLVHVAFGQGQFYSPRGVAVDGDGNILVVGGRNNRIQKFTAEGQFLTGVPVQSLADNGIAVNPCNGMVYVTDISSHCVHILDSDLTYSSIIGKEGSGKGQFKSPYGIACGSTGKVYVADSGNNRIQVFTANGKFLRFFSSCELNGPCGIAIDSGGLVYVSEGGTLVSHFTGWSVRVSVFTSEGQFVMSFGRRGQGPGEFRHPRGLAVDSSGVVYVCDSSNSRVQMF